MDRLWWFEQSHSITSKLNWKWQDFHCIAICRLFRPVNSIAFLSHSAPISSSPSRPQRHQQGRSVSMAAAFHSVAPAAPFLFLVARFSLPTHPESLFFSFPCRFYVYSLYSYHSYLYHCFVMPFSTAGAHRARRRRRSQRQRRNVSFPRSRHSLRHHQLRDQPSADVEDCFDLCQTRGLHLDPDTRISAAVGSSGTRLFRTTIMVAMLMVIHR